MSLSVGLRAAIALLALAPPALSAQTPPATGLGIAIGVARAPEYGRTATAGGLVGLRVHRELPHRFAYRVDAEYQWFGARVADVFYDVPCLQICPPIFPSFVGGGPIRSGSLVASVEWYEQPGRRGFYLLAGLGPEFFFSHPDPVPRLHLVSQAGAGIALPIGPFAVLAEVRYQRRLGEGVEPSHVVPVTLGFLF